MADLRIPSASVPAVVRPQAVARLDAVRSAQRAFFQAALGDVSPAPASASGASASKGASAPAKAEPSASPQRMARPGSIIDIKV